MSIFGRIKKAFLADGNSSRRVLMRYDAATTRPIDKEHWAGASNSDANSEACAEVRRILRNKARYEVANNSYAKGIVLTLANYMIGTGPRIQLTSDYDGDAEQACGIEWEFMRWSKLIRLPEKLRRMRMARIQDGEVFCILFTNPAQDIGSVRLDISLIEADHIEDKLWPEDPQVREGIRYDNFWNPVSYRVLKEHPGSNHAHVFDDADVYPASEVIHYFRADRPEQLRGVPELTPALPLFAQMRRYTLAVLSAAEAAADFAGVIYTDMPPDGEAQPYDAMEDIELHRNSMLTLPGGWKIDQLDPKQPCSTYGDFKREVLNEIARCLNMPYNVAAGNSSGYNYASGRLDWQAFFKALRVDQEDMESNILDRLFAAWYKEFRLSRQLPPDIPPHSWYWDGNEHVDPAKEANAQSTRLASCTTSLAAEYARQGKDWEDELHQIARERKLARELGVTMASAPQPEEDDNER